MNVARQFFLFQVFATLATSSHAGLVAVGDRGGGVVDTSGVLAEKRIVAVAAGANHFLVLSADGQVFARGDSTRGQLGNGVSGDNQGVVATAPGPELAGRPFAAISAGFDTSYALTSDGQLLAWGLNHFGQLGNGHHDLTFHPQAVVTGGTLAGRRVTAVSAGFLHCLALTDDGRVFAWGENSVGQLGDGTTNNSCVPVAVDMSGAMAGKTVSRIAAGASFSLAMTDDGKIFGWGYNEFGALGDGTGITRLSPVAVDLSVLPAGVPVSSLAVGSGFALVLTRNGRIFAWGHNDHGQLGDGTNETRWKPIAADLGGALAGRQIVAVAAGGGHSLARTADGMLFAWGYNQFGQLNVPGVNISRLLPTAMEMEGAFVARVVTGLASGPTAFYTLFLTTGAARTDLDFTPGDVRFSVTGEPATAYQLQRAGSLAPPVMWKPLALLTTDAAGTVTYSDPAPIEPAFWRTVPAP